MALAKFPGDLPKMMFERYQNVLLLSLWTFQLTVYFWPADLRLHNPAKTSAWKVIDFTVKISIYSGDNCVSQYRHLNSKDKFQIFAEVCCPFYFCAVDYFPKFCFFSIMKIIYFFQPLLQCIQILLIPHLTSKFPAEPLSSILAG